MSGGDKHYEISKRQDEGQQERESYLEAGRRGELAAWAAVGEGTAVWLVAAGGG